MFLNIPLNILNFSFPNDLKWFTTKFNKKKNQYRKWEKMKADKQDPKNHLIIKAVSCIFYMSARRQPK